MPRFLGWPPSILAAALLVAVLSAFPGSVSSPAEGPPAARTGFVYHEAYLQHDPGPGHPERPERLRAILAHLEKRGLLRKLRRIAPRPAPREWLTTIHARDYVLEVERACHEQRPFLHSGDTALSVRSHEAARLAAGGVLSAIDAVMAGDVRNAFCAVRPPGHHALNHRAMGFCLFNNVAIGARYAQRKYHLRRVLIVDWDVHHGNGTQAAFYDDPSVLYFSVHQSPFYPGTGSAEERGSGPGEGFTLNAPLPAGSGDEDYVRVFERLLKPRALDFAPDFVLISAGFDAHEDDPLGAMKVATEAYGKLTQIVRDVAEQCCSGRVVSVLEGGYDLQALAESVEKHLLALLEKR